MNTSFRMLTVAGALLVGGLAVTPLMAQDAPAADGQRVRRMAPRGPGFGPGPGPGGLMGPNLRALDLSDAQRQQVRDIMSTHSAETRTVGQRMREAYRGLNALVTADTLDEAAIRAKSADIAAAQADMAILRARINQDVFSILTAEQQAKSRELRDRAQERQKERASQPRERRQPRRPGLF